MEVSRTHANYMNTMMQSRLLLLNELQELTLGLQMGNKLILKPIGSILLCQFVLGGLVRHVVEVSSKPLIDALLQKSVGGIIEGVHYQTFSYTFKTMALQVKAQVLLTELELDQAAEGSTYLPAFVA